MPINKTILLKLNEKTENQNDVREFLLALINFEKDNKGWYKKEYKKILERCCREE